MTNLEDALVAVAAGADAVGFVFYENSPRYVTVERAREIGEKLPRQVDKVGVFVNQHRERVASIVDQSGLTAVQFHGDEYKNPGQHWVGGKMFFCLPVTAPLEPWEKFEGGGPGFWGIPNLPREAGVVLDSSTQTQRGGTGKTFDWREAQSLVVRLKKWHPVVVAGGLTPGNVPQAIETLDPWGVDVVSGVEASPGKKDPEKVRAFVRAVREMERKAG